MMKAKQLIYTSWKNGSSTKKGFMVYSASEGISVEDTEAIVNLMRYTTLPSLPYVPTWEQIEEMFPREASYFKLPSGNYCLAQSSYLGKDYSGRLNNYIIHAFVLDKEPDFNPLSVIHTDFFRRFLTEEELNAESNPPPLPEVELSQPQPAIPVDKLKEYFTPERLEILEYLLCAINEGAKTEQPVYLYDDYQTLIYWYEALRYCLPQNFKPTFTTYASIRSNVWSIQSIKPGSLLNYRMELQSKRFVYNIKENYINRDVPIGRYSHAIVRAFAEDPTSVFAKVAAVGVYLDEAEGNLDTAVLLSDLYAKRTSAFSDPQSLEAAFACAKKSGRLSTAQLVEIVYAIIGTNPAFNFENAREAFSFVAEHGDSVVRNKIIAEYLRQAETAHASEPAHTLASAVEETISKAPFNWQLFIEYAEHRYGLEGYLSLYTRNAFMTELMIKSLAGYGNERQISSLKKVLLTALQQGDYTAAMGVISPLKQRGSIQALINEAFRTEINESNGGFFAQGNPSFTFSILKEVRQYVDEISLLVFMIRYHCRIESFAEQFENYVSANGITESAIQAKASGDPSVSSFLETMEIRRFLKSAPTRESLMEFYDRIYRAGKDHTGVFEQMLEKLLSGKFGEERISAALEWREYFTRAGERNPHIYDMLAKYALDADFKTTYNLMRKNRGAAKQLEDFAVATGKTEGNAYAAVQLVTLFERAVKEGKSYEELMRQVQYGTLMRFDPAIMSGLAEQCFSAAFKIYSKGVAEKKRDCELIAEKVVGAFGEANGVYVTKTAEELKKLPPKKVVEYLIPFATCAMRNGSEKCACARILSEYFALEKKSKQVLDELCAVDSLRLSDRDKQFLSALLPPQTKKPWFKFW